MGKDIYDNVLEEHIAQLIDMEMKEISWTYDYRSHSDGINKHWHRLCGHEEIEPEYNFLSPIWETAKRKYDFENKYKVKVGTTLGFWENKGWITKHNPYGWVHWYCDYKKGKRGPDDERQIKRWLKLAGPKGRFRRFLVTQIIKKKGKWNDETTSPKIRQVLQHWGYKLTKKDYDTEIKRRRRLTKKI